MAKQMQPEQRKHYEDAMIGFLLAHPEHISEVHQILLDQTYFTNHDNAVTYYFLCEMDSHGIVPKGRQLPAELFRLSNSETGKKRHLVYSHGDDMALNRSLAQCLALWNREYGGTDGYKELAKFIKWHCHDSLRIQELAQDIADKVGGIPAQDSQEFATSLSQKFDKIALRVQDAGELQHISEATDDIEAVLDRMGNWEPISNSIETGLKGLDNVLGGLNGGEIIVLAAQTGAGKTALSMAIAENVALGIGTGEPHSVIIFSLEMMNTQLHFRLASRLGHINTEKFNLDYRSIVNRQTRIDKGENMPPDEIDQLERDKADFRRRYERLRETVQYAKSLPIYQDTAGNMNVSVMKTMISQKQKEMEENGEPPLGLVIIDYLQILQPTPEDANENRSVVVGNMSRRIKQMAKDAGVPVLLLAQLNRQSDVDQKPKLSHLRESGSIEQDADKVIFLYCEYASRELRDYASEYDTEAQQDLAMKRDQMKVKIAVEKNRQGRQGEVNAIFDKQYQNFVTQTPSFKKGETFETFFDKYYQKTRTGRDLFWPMKVGEVAPSLEKYRSIGLVECEYLGPDNQIVLPDDGSQAGPSTMTVSSRPVARKAQPTLDEDLGSSFSEDAGGYEQPQDSVPPWEQAPASKAQLASPAPAPQPDTDDVSDPDERYDRGWHEPPFSKGTDAARDAGEEHSDLDVSSDFGLYDDDEEFDLSGVEEFSYGDDDDDEYIDDYDGPDDDSDDSDEEGDDSLALLDELSGKL